MTSSHLSDGDALLLWRREHGLTQSDLGEILGCTRQTIANYEANRTRLPKGFWPRLSTLRAAAVGSIKKVNKDREAMIKRECAKYRHNFELFGSHDSVIASYQGVKMPNGQLVTAWLAMPENADILAALEETRNQLEKGN